MRILLLADESITVQRVIALTFAHEPIQVVSVGDGQQAIEKMAALAPDIVLAATTLPTVNGYDLAKFMRGKTELRSVPVVLLAGAFETVDEARLASSGANGFIEKPVEPTNVIGRVKELLGLKSDEPKPATPAGRTVTPAVVAGGKDEKKLPVPSGPRAVTNPSAPARLEPLRNQAALEPNARSVEPSSTRSDDYLDTLDSAFDSLDQQLSGRAATTKPRNPSGPLAQAGGSPDPRSPGRAPSSEPAVSGNPIFEVDDEWFSESDSQARADARAGRREIIEDLNDAGLQRPAAPAPANPIFEVDDDWFKGNQQARVEKSEEQRALATEMGIHDVDLPEKAPAAKPVAASDLDFDFGPRDLPRQAQAPSPAASPVEPVAAPAEIRVVAPEITDDILDQIAARVSPPQITDATLDQIASRVAPPQITDATLDQIASRVAPPPITDATLDQIASRVAPPPITDATLDQIASRVAPPQITDAMLDHIAARVAPPAITGEMLAQIAAGVAPPAINDEMLDRIASRVAERLNASTFGEQLREQIAAALRDTVRSVVSETAERLVRDEIDRIKNKR